MRIALVIERLDVHRGGRETSTAQIATDLARRGHDVTVVCQSGSWKADGVSVRHLGTRGLGRAAKMRHFVAAAQDHIRGGGYDIVHAMFALPGANVFQPRGGTVRAQLETSMRRRTVLGAGLVYLTQPLNRCRWEMVGWERQVVADPNVLCLALSQMVAREFSHYYGRTEGVRVIYNGVEAPDWPAGEAARWRQELRAKIGAADDETVFLTVATNFVVKGVAQAIECFARWYHARGDRPRGRLVIVGRELAENYHRHAALRDVGPVVVFVPPTPEIFRWHAASDVCMLLSWYDTCSRVLLEAMLLGNPCITTAYNGAGELLGQGPGLVVPSPRSKREIVAAMEELADPARRAAYTEACRRMAGWLSMSRHVDELLTAYAEVKRRP